tara:strand:- start:1743 stop:3122 length:1380 start_codon:yes stop_codon:yes gene_type:complete
MKLNNELMMQTNRWILVMLICSVMTEYSYSQSNTDWLYGNYGHEVGGQMDLISDREMVITTHGTGGIFFESDEYSFAYKKQTFPFDDASKSTVTVKVGEMNKGSAGIMMRSSNELGASNVHLNVDRIGDVLLLFREIDNEKTKYKRLAANLSFPVEIKLVRQGNSFTGYYKESGLWKKGETVAASIGSMPLTGLYATAGRDNDVGVHGEGYLGKKVTFTDWSFDYEEKYIPGESNPREETPITQLTLLRDDFDDGMIPTEFPTITNPCWKGIVYGVFPFDEKGGRYWSKEGYGTYFLGDKKWGDYLVSIDLSFEEVMYKDGVFQLFLRYQDISIYTNMIKYYTLTFREGKVFFEKYDSKKRVFSYEIEISNYADNTFRSFKISFLDGNYSVYYEGKKVLEGSDEEPITYGNIGFDFSNVNMKLDNVEVLRVVDEINGDRDNLLLDYFDQPIPSFISQYQ